MNFIRSQPLEQLLTLQLLSLTNSSATKDNTNFINIFNSKKIKTSFKLSNMRIFIKQLGKILKFRCYKYTPFNERIFMLILL